MHNHAIHLASDNTNDPYFLKSLNFHNNDRSDYYTNILNIKEDCWYKYTPEMHELAVKLSEYVSLEAFCIPDGQDFGLFDLHHNRFNLIPIKLETFVWSGWDCNGEPVEIDHRNICKIRIRPQFDTLIAEVYTP